MAAAFASSRLHPAKIKSSTAPPASACSSVDQALAGISELERISRLEPKSSFFTLSFNPSSPPAMAAAFASSRLHPAKIKSSTAPPASACSSVAQALASVEVFWPSLIFLKPCFKSASPAATAVAIFSAPKQCANPSSSTPPPESEDTNAAACSSGLPMSQSKSTRLRPHSTATRKARTHACTSMWFEDTIATLASFKRGIACITSGAKSHPTPCWASTCRAWEPKTCRAAQVEPLRMLLLSESTTIFLKLLFKGASDAMTIVPFAP